MQNFENISCDSFIKRVQTKIEYEKRRLDYEREKRKQDRKQKRKKQ